MAASATFALKAGVWFRRARLLMVSPDSRAHRARRQAETPLSVLCRFPQPALTSADMGGWRSIHDAPGELFQSSLPGVLLTPRHASWTMMPSKKPPSAREIAAEIVRRAT